MILDRPPVLNTTGSLVRRAPLLRDRSVVFAIGNRTGHNGSTLLRAIQLEAILRDELHQHGLQSTVGIGPDDVTRAKVVVAKSFITDYGLAGLRTLAGAANEIILDPLDWPLELNVLDMADHILASSSHQYAFLQQRMRPGARIHFIPHHVDLRMPAIACQCDYFRIGYFGNRKNIHLPGRSFPGFPRKPPADVIAASKPNNTTWIDLLPDYNCHYLFRDPHSLRAFQFKPFVKGYIAAHCGAVVIASEADTEVLCQLGPDYPFLYGVRTARDIRRAVADTARAFNTPRWASALARMENLKKTYSLENIRAGMIAALT